MNRKRILSIVIIAVVIFLIVIVNNQFEDNNYGYQKGDLTAKMGTRPDEEFKYLNADELCDVDDSSFVKLEKVIQKKADYADIKHSVEMWLGGPEGFVLTDTEGLSVSKCNIPLVNVRNSTVVNETYEYLFSDGEAVGRVTFFMANGKLINNLSLHRADRRGDNFYFLENHKDMSFILVSDGFTHYFLGEDNNVYNISTGNKVFWFTVEGDCYEALGADKYSVSYEKIVDRIELIQE